MLRLFRLRSRRAPRVTTDIAGDDLAPLVGRLRADRRDVVAERALLGAVAPRMLRTIRRVLGPAHPEREDVLQEALLGFVRALGSFRGECTVVHFSCRVAVLTAMNHRRRAQLYASDAAALETVPAAQLDPAERAEASARAAALGRVLDALPGAQAEALALHCVEGFTVEEIARACGAPVETVRSRLRLAKAALRARLANDRAAVELLQERP